MLWRVNVLTNSTKIPEVIKENIFQRNFLVNDKKYESGVVQISAVLGPLLACWLSKGVL